MKDRATETKAVKKALVASGFKGAQVAHGRGTSYGWLYITLGPDDIRRSPEAVKVAQEATGRHGDYDGNINIFWP